MTNLARIHVLSVGCLLALVPGCFDDGDFLNGPGAAGVKIELSVPAGKVDTLALGSTARAIIDARELTAGVTVGLQRRGDSALSGLPMNSAVIELMVTAHGLGTASPTPRNQAALSSADLLSLRLELAYLGTGLGLTNVAFRPAADAASTTFWTTATTSSYLDPRTGQTVTTRLVDLRVPPNGLPPTLIALADEPSTCDLPREFRLRDSPMTPDDRIPLILVHGWQALMRTCRDQWFTLGAVAGMVTNYEDFEPNTFDAFLAHFGQVNSALRSKFKVYVMKYPTYLPIVQAAGFLRDQLVALGGPPPVIVGHSMGGLVGRSMLGLPGAPPIRGLITLGTPHEGSPIADVLARTSAYGADDILLASFLCGTLELGAFTTLISKFPMTAGLRDMATNSPFTEALREDRSSKDRIFTFGGQLSAADTRSTLLAFPSCILGQMTDNAPNDGIVTATSAVPPWTAVQGLLSGYDHLQLGGGKTGDTQLFDRVVTVLDRLSQCRSTTPPPLAHNDFVLSGAIARANDRETDIVLNAITVDGDIQRNLTAGNFEIIENGCNLSNFRISTKEGSVGVDLMFAQDLSSSMSEEVAGVRGSVITFAQGLAAHGFNIRIGSLGYSGPGDIPSTPARSFCEFLGPFQQPTTPGEFELHVAGFWIALAGCDVPENGLEALEYIHANTAWRVGAARVYVDITDASHHTKTTNCNGLGSCTDHDLGSITALLGGSSVVHSIASSNSSARTAEGGMDPWLLADATGGRRLVLPASGNVDLTGLGIADVIGQTVRLTFSSATSVPAPHNLRLRVTIGAKVAELAFTDVLTYSRLHASLQR